jgi:hypothetical protein
MHLVHVRGTSPSVYITCLYFPWLRLPLADLKADPTQASRERSNQQKWAVRKQRPQIRKFADLNYLLLVRFANLQKM